MRQTEALPDVRHLQRRNRAPVSPVSVQAEASRGRSRRRLVLIRGQIGCDCRRAADWTCHCRRAVPSRLAWYGASRHAVNRSGVPSWVRQGAHLSSGQRVSFVLSARLGAGAAPHTTLFCARLTVPPTVVRSSAVASMVSVVGGRELAVAVALDQLLAVITRVRSRAGGTHGRRRALARRTSWASGTRCGRSRRSRNARKASLAWRWRRWRRWLVPLRSFSNFSESRACDS